ncbi:unnamed protein product [Hyaloperonospora brassicae]|uniref:Uncharacterized protein n=1 Tax=Hyaloperonospora brassicae TaxID=162125 RepID=A0AAV0U4E9_HYABA|nr:unnamed protein product [Hyaloperonospora brassicae]
MDSSSSDDDHVPIAMLRKKSKTPTLKGSSPSTRRSVKQETPFKEDEDSDSVPLVQLKKKKKTAERDQVAKRNGVTADAKKAVVKKETGVKRKVSSSSSSSLSVKSRRTASNGKVKVRD